MGAEHLADNGPDEVPIGVDALSDRRLIARRNALQYPLAHILFRNAILALGSGIGRSTSVPHAATTIPSPLTAL